MRMAPTRSAILYYQFGRFDYQACLLTYSFVQLTHSFRIWDVENKRKQKTVIVVKSKERGTRTKITTCAYSPDGRLISGGISVSSCAKLPPDSTIYRLSGRVFAYVECII